MSTNPTLPAASEFRLPHAPAGFEDFVEATYSEWRAASREGAVTVYIEYDLGPGEPHAMHHYVARKAES